jgi:hypothetical protein
MLPLALLNLFVTAPSSRTRPSCATSSPEVGLAPWSSSDARSSR